MNEWTIVTIGVAVITFITVILCLLSGTKIKGVSLYWIVGVLGAAICSAINIGHAGNIFGILVSDSAINPLKILVFFLAMSIMSIILDKLGFIKYLSHKAAKLAANSQKKLFAVFYVLVSILTIFTSNDIIILSFVPFICYFCKYSNIDAKPYVMSAFVGANTWSMLLIIGNPTNVYMGAYAQLDFVGYFTVMAIPTLVSGILSAIALLIIFSKSLAAPITAQMDDDAKPNKMLMYTNVVILLVCIIFLSLSSVFDVEMWLIAVVFLALQIFINILLASFAKINKSYLKDAFKSAPWNFIPFLLSMFIIIMCLQEQGITAYMYKLLSRGNSFFVYGIASFLFSNIVNNIPMTTLFASVLSNGAINLPAVYATIIGSNLGAMLTPIGALAGIMFLNILKDKDVSLSALEFIKYGAIISVISLVAALLTLSAVI